MKEAIRQIIEFLEKNNKEVEAALIDTMLQELLLRRQTQPAYVTKRI